MLPEQEDIRSSLWPLWRLQTWLGWAGHALQALRPGRPAEAAFCPFLRRILVFGLLAVAGTGAASAGQPAPRSMTGAEKPIDFDIPAQPLATALEAFSVASGYQILMADTGSQSGGHSHAIKGVFFPRDALAQVIAGSGLEVRFTAAQAAVLVRREAVSNNAGLDPSPGERRRFEARLQTEVMRALCRNPATRPGGYRAALELWVASSGRIDRAALLGSTGDRDRDQGIIAALDALRLQAPPPGLAQPATLLLMPGVPESARVCDAFPPVIERAGTR